MEIDFNVTLKHKDCVSKYVKCQTIDKLTHEGWLKTIDPLTGNLILVTLESESNSVETILIMADALVKLDVIKDADEHMVTMIRDLYSFRATSPSEDISDRKERLVAWIKKNRLPVQELDDDSLVVCEAVTIQPPYRVDNCISSNGRVLMNIQNLVTNLPEEEVKVESSS